MGMTQIWICFIIMCRTKVLLSRFQLWELILPNIAPHNPTSMWSTLCGKISFVPLTKICNGPLTSWPRGKARIDVLKHYRVQSDGWKDSGLCVECMDNHQEMKLPFRGCDLSVDCKCKMCTRQPPSLADSAWHVLFNYTLHLDRFHLEMDTPYDLYVYAARSNRMSHAALLPPEAPMITIWYCNDIDSPFKFHRDCLGAGSWLNQSERKYN